MRESEDKKVWNVCGVFRTTILKSGRFLSMLIFTTFCKLLHLPLLFRPSLWHPARIFPLQRADHVHQQCTAEFELIWTDCICVTPSEMSEDTEGPDRKLLVTSRWMSLFKWRWIIYSEYLHVCGSGWVCSHVDVRIFFSLSRPLLLLISYWKS